MKKTTKTHNNKPLENNPNELTISEMENKGDNEVINDGNARCYVRVQNTESGLSKLCENTMLRLKGQEGFSLSDVTTEGLYYIFLDYVKNAIENPIIRKEATIKGVIEVAVPQVISLQGFALFLGYTTTKFLQTLRKREGLEEVVQIIEQTCREFALQNIASGNYARAMSKSIALENLFNQATGGIASDKVKIGFSNSD
jgi:hypothetical protein